MPEVVPTAGVRRWVRRPLIWALVAALLGVWAWQESRLGADREDRAFAHALLVPALPVHGRPVDGDEYVDLAYHHPLGDQRFRIDDVWVPERSTHGTSIPLFVDRADPTHVRVAGDGGDQPLDLWLAELPAVGVLLLGWGWRRLKVRRTRRVANDLGVPTPMQGLPVAPRWWGGHWTLQLRTPDAAPGSRPTCAVPLVEAPLVLDARPVDATGALRRWRRVVVRDHETREVLWPAGRCVPVLGRRRRRQEPSRPMPPQALARWLLIAAVVLGLVGIAADLHQDDALESEERSYAIRALVVDRDAGHTAITYRWLGEELDAKVAGGARLRPGDTTKVDVDPRHPGRVWLPGHDAPGPEDLSGYLWLLALLLLPAGLIVRWVQRSRSQRPDPVFRPPPYAPPPREGWPVPAETVADDRGWVAVPPPPPGPTSSWTPPAPPRPPGARRREPLRATPPPDLGP